jgi:hypothetical protein
MNSLRRQKATKSEKKGSIPPYLFFWFYDDFCRLFFWA